MELTITDYRSVINTDKFYAVQKKVSMFFRKVGCIYLVPNFEYTVVKFIKRNIEAKLADPAGSVSFVSDFLHIQYLCIERAGRDQEYGND